MIETTRRCDNPSCRVAIPPAARHFTLVASIGLRHGEALLRSAITTRAEDDRVVEVCGQACLLATISALIRELMEAEHGRIQLEGSA